MAAAAKKNTLLMVGGGIAGLFGVYEFVYKPWKAAQDAALIAAGQSPLGYTTTGGGGGGGGGFPIITSPSVLTGGITPSNLDPGAAVGGEVGSCMHYKGWTQQQCTTRLGNIHAAYQAAMAELAKLQSGSGAEAQAALAANQAALPVAIAAYNAALARGDQGGAAQIKLAIDGHNADIAALNARLASIPSRIMALQSAIAGWKTEYQNLTHMALA